MQRFVLTVVVALAVSAAPASAATFTNSAPIPISDGVCPGQGTGSPYPSNITVSALAGTVSDVNVTLNNFSHGFSSDVRVLLVGPGGQTALLMHEAGGNFAVAGVTFTLDDEAAGPVPAPIVAGSYKPTQTEVNCQDNDASTSLPGPAPIGPYGLTLAGFDGTAPNGTWSLYVVDQFDGDTGAFGGGWSLDITTAAPAPVTRTVDDDLVQCPMAGYQTIQAAVTAAGPGDTINVCRGTYPENVVIGAGKDGLSLISSTSALAAVVQGSAPFSVTDGVEGVSIQRFRIETAAGGTGIAVGSGAASGEAELIRNNLILGGSRGIHVARGDIDLARDNMIRDYTESGVLVASSGTGPSYANLSNNTLIGTPTSSGIAFNGLSIIIVGTGGTVFANSISKNGVAGINVLGAHPTLKANTVFQNGIGLNIAFAGPPGIAENNKLNGNTAEGIRTGTAGWTFTSNNAKSNGGTDCFDNSPGGGGTAGTGNTWTGNYGLESNPAGICKP